MLLMEAQFERQNQAWSARGRRAIRIMQLEFVTELLFAPVLHVGVGLDQEFAPP